MRTDITKINEKTPHDRLTEGLMVFNGGTSLLFAVLMIIAPLTFNPAVTSTESNNVSSTTTT